MRELIESIDLTWEPEVNGRHVLKKGQITFAVVSDTID